MPYGDAMLIADGRTNTNLGRARHRGTSVKEVHSLQICMPRRTTSPNAPFDLKIGERLLLVRLLTFQGKRAEHRVLGRDELYGHASLNYAPFDFIFGVDKL